MAARRTKRTRVPTTPATRRSKTKAPTRKTQSTELATTQQVSYAYSPTPAFDKPFTPVAARRTPFDIATQFTRGFGLSPLQGAGIVFGTALLAFVSVKLFAPPTTA